MAEGIHKMRTHKKGNGVEWSIGPSRVGVDLVPRPLTDVRLHPPGPAPQEPLPRLAGFPLIARSFG